MYTRTWFYQVSSISCIIVIDVIKFSLKLETWIKLNKIPYENVYSIKFSKKGQIPYIELNGNQLADSNLIIPKLKVIIQINILVCKIVFLECNTEFNACL